MAFEDPCYSESLDEALAFAADAFRNVRRKASGVPYLTHLLQVAVTVGEHGGDEEQMIAALLHDYLEDIPGATADILSARFGTRVKELVEALTEDPNLQKAPWRERKEAYVTRSRSFHADARLICAADKLHNAQSILRDHEHLGGAVWSRFSGTPEQTKWYYRAMHQALAEGWQSPLLLRLEACVEKLQGLSETTSEDQ